MKVDWPLRQSLRGFSIKIIVKSLLLNKSIEKEEGGKKKDVIGKRRG